jgi:hypothetical protein
MSGRKYLVRLAECPVASTLSAYKAVSTNQNIQPAVTCGVATWSYLLPDQIQFGSRTYRKCLTGFEVTKLQSLQQTGSPVQSVCRQMLFNSQDLLASNSIQLGRDVQVRECCASVGNTVPPSTSFLSFCIYSLCMIFATRRPNDIHPPIPYDISGINKKFPKRI